MRLSLTGCRAAFAAALLGVVAVVSAQMSCRVMTNQAGADTYVLEGAPEGTFDCMMIENDDPPLTPKEVVTDNDTTQDICSLEKKAKVTSYALSDVPTITKCKFECRPSQLRCLAAPEAGDTQCSCMNSGPRAAMVPLTLEESMTISVQSATSSSLQSDLCKGKAAGAVIGPMVNCQGIAKEFPAMHLAPIGLGAPICTMQPHPRAGETHTVYEKMLGDSGMACNSVCRLDKNFKCDSGAMGSNNQCLCGAPNVLVPRLVPVDLSMAPGSHALVREDGTMEFDAEGPCYVRDGVDSCGQCGKCEEGRCVLAELELNLKNHCRCGYICPTEADILARESGLGAPIMCIRNERLTDPPCSEGSGDGTVRPDFCLESDEGDIYDQCVCAKTHREVLGMYNEAGHNTCVLNDRE
jgi:hypothetical protein